MVADDSDFYLEEGLKRDFKEAKVVAYINSKKVLSIGRSDASTDCSNFPKKEPDFGYCMFTMEAEIKELYKGKLSLETLVYSEYGEAGLIQNKEQFLGEQVVFLEAEKGTDGRIYYQVIENSTRDIKQSVLEKMRRIAKYKPK